MTAGKARQRQVEQARLVLIDKRTGLLMRGEILTVNEEPRAGFLGRHFDGDARLVGLRTDDSGHPALQNAGLLRRDQRDRVAEKRLVVKIDRRDDRYGRLLNHIGRVEAPAHADLQDQRIGSARVRKRAAPRRW